MIDEIREVLKNKLVTEEALVGKTVEKVAKDGSDIYVVFTDKSFVCFETRQFYDESPEVVIAQNDETSIWALKYLELISEKTYDKQLKANGIAAKRQHKTYELEQLKRLAKEYPDEIKKLLD